MQTSISISANYVLILEWLNDGDQKTGLALCERLEQRKVSAVRVDCHSAADTHAGILRAIAEIKVRGTPIVHIESHGTDPRVTPMLERGFGTDKELVLWREFGEWLAPLNHASDFNILVVGAACWGLSAIGALSLHRYAPFMGCVGFTTSVVEDSLRDAMLELYRALMTSGDLVGAVDAATHELHDSDEKLAFTSAARLATMTAVDTCRKTTGPGEFEKLVPTLETASKLPEYAGKDVSEATWRKNYEAVAHKIVENLWSEWFPASVQARSSAYRLDWAALRQDLFGTS